MVTQTISIASLSNTSGLSDLLSQLSEGKEIVWAARPDGDLQVRLVDQGRSSGEEVIVREGLPGRTAITPIPVSRPLRRRPKHHAALTDKRLGIVERLWSIVLSRAHQSGLAVSGEIGVEESVAEEKANQVVLAVHVDGNARQALAFWKSLDVDMDRWLARLPAYDQRLLLNNIGLRFSWVE
jgi:hypothetical protein